MMPSPTCTVKTLVSTASRNESPRMAKNFIGRSRYSVGVNARSAFGHGLDEQVFERLPFFHQMPHVQAARNQQFDHGVDTLAIGQFHLPVRYLLADSIAVLLHLRTRELLARREADNIQALQSGQAGDIAFADHFATL